MSTAAVIAFTIWVAVLAGLAALIVWDCTRPLAHLGARPRAARIMQPASQTWICPELPGGRVVVRRDVCYVLGWPEPTL